ncbi:universal stress protein [Azospirillum agricola]|uniref:universal stress protein n=1 Tax=Azospirillum agricola TaxID=1720247 RepID=UPI000A0F18DF|nr:universal stress protein [Azospirillum agricola]SMH46057.1 Universal stress protein family protein [Azospirillum lipoferum]
MSYKEILVHFDHSPAGVRRIEAAARLAERLDAHLTGLVIRVQPQFRFSAEIPPPASVMAALERGATETAERAAAALDAVLARQGCATGQRLMDCPPAMIADRLALHARYADLLVLGQPGGDEASDIDDHDAELLLLSSGRPVLLIPHYGTFPTIGERVLVAWDARREAARAVADAMPLIEMARSVQVLTVNPEAAGRHGEDPGADIARHLARHNASVDTLSLRSDELDPADLTLNQMADSGTDLLVMGAYGHSRLRELVLGGMTRAMLKRMTVPVLMSH